jgi:hypothetical protein
MKVQLKFILISDPSLTVSHYTFVIFVFVYDFDLSTKFGKENCSWDVTFLK